jgi:hypothetical protein
MKKFGPESPELSEEDIDGVDAEMDLISDGPEEETELPVPLDPYTEAIPGTNPGIRIDREAAEEQEEQ